VIAEEVAFLFGMGVVVGRGVGVSVGKGVAVGASVAESVFVVGLIILAKSAKETITIRSASIKMMVYSCRRLKCMDTIILCSCK
jgi:hypothetical protein